MRITYLHQYFVPPDASGGTRSYEFARRLIAAGHQVRMITSVAMLPEKYMPSDGKTYETEIAGIPTVVIPVQYANEMSFAARIRAFIRFAALASYEAMRHPTDLIFATSTPLTIAIPAILGKLWQRVPMTFEVRDLWPELPIALGFMPNPLLRAGALGLEWLAYKSADQIVALSPGMASGVAARGIQASKITVIPNSSDIELFDVPASRGQHIRERLPELAPDQPLIVYTGTFGLINGADYMVDIAAAMRTIAPEIRFLMVGSGAERDKIIQKARDTGALDSNLWVWKPIPKNEMPDLMAAATVATSLFIPLKEMWKNSANKFFDALAAGKPIAINYGDWQADLLRETGAGIVLPPHDPREAARELAAFVRDPERLRQAAAASRNLALTRFHRDTMAQMLEAVLRRAAGHPPATRPSTSYE